MSAAALAAGALLAGDASAATLFATAAHASRVAHETTSSTGTNFDLFSGTTLINHCPHYSGHHTVSQNSDARIIITELYVVVHNCASPVTPTFTSSPWSLVISGTGSITGASTCWNATLLGMAFDLLGGSYSGSLTSGVTACQPTSAGSPISVRFANAGVVTGPLTGNGRIGGSFVFTGAGAGWSLTN